MNKNQSIVHKKAQLTLLLLIGTALLLILFLFIFFLDEINAYAQKITTEVGRSENEQDQYDILKQCLAVYAEQGLESIEAQGGYISLPRESILLKGTSLGIFSTQGIQRITLEDIQKDLAEYIEENTQKSCFTDEEKYDKEYPKEIEAHVEFRETDMIISIDWPVRFRSKEDPTEIFTLVKTGIKEETHFKSLYEQAEYILSTKMDIQQQYFNTLEVNVTLFLYENTSIALLNQEEEYFIIAREP